MDTGSRKWGRPYLNRRFFSLLGERMADRVLLIMARRGRPLDRRRAQPDRRRLPLRPQLGLRRGRALPALRALLLPGHRVGHRPRPGPGRGRARRASTRSPAATCPPPSTPPTTSPTRPCARRSPASSSRSGAAVRGRDGVAGGGILAVRRRPWRRRRCPWPPEVAWKATHATLAACSRDHARGSGRGGQGRRTLEALVHLRRRAGGHGRRHRAPARLARRRAPACRSRSSTGPAASRSA